MSFLFPLGLAGLLSLPVIVLLHLSNARNEQAIVSSLKLWEFLPIELRGARARRLKVSLLLLIDLLIATLISLGLARPHLPLPELFEPRRQILILLDTSSSMLAQDVAPDRFSQAQHEIAELIATQSPSSVYTLIGFDDRPTLLADSREGGAAAVALALETSQAGGHSGGVAAAYALGQTYRDAELPLEVHVYTDAAFPLEAEYLLTEEIAWHIVGRYTENQAILSLTADQTAENQFRVVAQFMNTAAEPRSTTVTLRFDGQTLTQEAITLPAVSSSSQSWTYTGELGNLEAALSGGDAYPLDDQASFAYNPPRPLQVALVADDPFPLDKALAIFEGVELDIYTAADQPAVGGYDLVVARNWEPPLDKWPSGMTVLVEPPTTSAVASLNDLLVTLSGPVLQASDPILDNLNLSAVQWGRAWQLADNTSCGSPLVSVGGAPVLLRCERDDHEALVLLAQLGSGDLIQNPAFPLLLFNITEAARSGGLPDSLAFGQALDTELDFEINAPGLYTFNMDDANGRPQQVNLAVNAGDIDESALGPHAWADTLPTNVAVAGIQSSEEFDLTPWLLVLAAILLLWEARLAWR